jgi:hypothetical protein
LILISNDSPVIKRHGMALTNKQVRFSSKIDARVWRDPRDAIAGTGAPLCFHIGENFPSLPLIGFSASPLA